MPTRIATIRRPVVSLVFWLGCSSSWATCNPDVGCDSYEYPAPATWSVLATVAQLPGGFYDYTYRATPSRPDDLVHTLRSITLTVPDAAAIGEVRVPTGIWENATYRIVPPSTSGSPAGASSIEFSGNLTMEAWSTTYFSYINGGVGPLNGLEFGFKSRYAPMLAPYQVALVGSTYSYNYDEGTHTVYVIGSDRVQVGNTLVPSPVPEPKTMTLVLAGAASLLAMRRRHSGPNAKVI